jgi:Xaa-Pro aminopeptidase
VTETLLPRANAGDPASGGPVDYPRFSDAERDHRWALVRALMQRDGIDQIVGFPNSHKFDSFQASTRYLTGIGGNCAAVGVVFPQSGDVTAIVSPDQDPDYLRAVQDWVADIRTVSPAWAYAPPYLERLRELGAQAGTRIGVIGLSGNTRYAEGSASHGLITSIQHAFPRAEIVNATFLLDEARYVKSDQELHCIEQATRLAELALDVLRTEARPGLTERALIARMLASMIEAGGDLPTMILWSAGWPQPPSNHYQPTGRELRAGDMFATELEARWAGYVGQRTQMGFLGPIPPLYQDLARVQTIALERCYELLRPGHTIGELVAACTDVTVDTPFTCRILMHGKGLGDDAPIAIYGTRDKRMADWPIENNACFVIKPMVMRGEKEQFVYWGDTVVATPRGARRLGSQSVGLLQID